MTDYPEDEIYQETQKISLQFQPSKQWAYSNLEYVMLGILIIPNRASGYT